MESLSWLAMLRTSFFPTCKFFCPSLPLPYNKDPYVTRYRLCFSVANSLTPVQILSLSLSPEDKGLPSASKGHRCCQIFSRTHNTPRKSPTSCICTSPLAGPESTTSCVPADGRAACGSCQTGRCKRSGIERSSRTFPPRWGTRMCLTILPFRAGCSASMGGSVRVGCGSSIEPIRHFPKKKNKGSCLKIEYI
jgi:hypothetical protein